MRAARIHGNRSQSQRTQALEGFKAGRFDVLVATDIAARGIDVAALGHVVNYDVPAAREDYIHRVGRTGRAELTGEAFTFVAPEDEHDLRAIERAIGKPLPRVAAARLRLPQKPPEAPPARHEAHPRHAPQGRPAARRRPPGPQRAQGGAATAASRRATPGRRPTSAAPGARPAASGPAGAPPFGPGGAGARARVRRDERSRSAWRTASRGQAFLVVGFAPRHLRELPPPLLLLLLRLARGRGDPPAQEALRPAAVGRQRRPRHDRDSS